MNKCITLFLALFIDQTGAAEWQLQPDKLTLQQQLKNTQPGDTVLLSPGTYHGPIVLNIPLIIKGKPGTILANNNKGIVVHIKAPNVELHHLTIQGWGDNLTELDAGIFIAKSANNTLINNNRLKGKTSGIWVDSTNNIKIVNNKIQGDLSLRSQDRGNGIHLFNVKKATVKNNEIWHTRDGIYIDNSNNNILENNYLHDLRYGIHFMYSHNNKVVNNRTRQTRTGYALMQSKYLTVHGNQSFNDYNYGILMNYITYSSIQNNQVSHVNTGSNPHLSQTRSNQIKGAEGKAIFIYNSLFNNINSNQLAHSDLGIHITVGSEKNKIYQNRFIGNKTQVKYVSTRFQEWSFNQQGNFWSDYLGWDMNNDSTGDTPYEPNDSMDLILWKYPQSKVLFNSPSITLLRWIQRHFPVFKVSGVKDSYPLMKISYPKTHNQLNQVNTHQGFN